MGWKEYYEDPFGYFDKTHINFLGMDLLLFKYHFRLRKIIWWAALLVWMLMGFDSGYGQLEYAVYAAKDWILNPTTSSLIEDVMAASDWAYGKTMHWSAFVIYGFLYWATSNYLESSLGLTKTRNSAYSLAFTLLNIGIFEWFWCYGYAFFHDQWWCVTWKMPQVRILIQNVMFSVLGLCSLLLFWIKSHVFDEEGNTIGRIYTFRPTKSFIIVTMVTIVAAGLWVEYPFKVQKVSTFIEGYGSWENGDKFPQTLYTVDTSLLDNINAGEWFYVQDDMVHLWNTGVKALLALSGLLFVRSWKP